MSWAGSFEHAAIAAPVDDAYARSSATDRVGMYTGHMSLRYPPMQSRFSLSSSSAVTDLTRNSLRPTSSDHNKSSNMKVQLPTRASQWSTSGNGSYLPPVSALEMLADTKDCQYMSSPSSLDIRSVCSSPIENGIKQQMSSPCGSPISPISSAGSSMFSRAGSKRPSEGPSEDALPTVQCVKRRKTYDVARQAKHISQGDAQLNERVAMVQEPFRKMVKIKSEYSTVEPDYNLPGDSKSKHNRAQADLRSDKAVQKMEVQHLLRLFGFCGDKLQSTSNARSSGLIWEDLDLLRGVGQVLSMTYAILQPMFGQKNMQHLGDCLEHFEPADFESIKARLDKAKPSEANIQGLSDDMKKKLTKEMCDAVRVEVMEEASAPLELKRAKSAEGVQQLVREKLRPLANDHGKAYFERLIRESSKAKL